MYTKFQKTPESFHGISCNDSKFLTIFFSNYQFKTTLLRNYMHFIYALAIKVKEKWISNIHCCCDSMAHGSVIFGKVRSTGKLKC
ncbi:hypothetical protein Mapa_008979 [Marchantia paleacea]|nr:hypothetical protein Mapa_008979 [Marchantia paleacea]